MDNHSGTLNVLLPEEDALLVFDWDVLRICCDMGKNFIRIFKSFFYFLISNVNLLSFHESYCIRPFSEI